MSMSNQSQTGRTRVIIIPSTIYSFKTTVETSYLQTVGEERDTVSHKNSFILKRNKIMAYKRDKK